MAKQIKAQVITEAVIYLRVSTDEQAKSGLGLEAQEARCRAWAEANGYDVAAVFVDDGASARTLKRPELEKALAALKPGRVLVSYRLDRLTRTQADFPALAARVEAAGGEWATVEERFDTSTAMGRAMLQIVLTFSQLEREQTGERTAAALAAKKARGERLGSTPLGWITEADGTVTVDPEEQATLRRARELRAAGHTFRAIGSMLMAEGHRSKRGGAWGPSTIRGMLEQRYIEVITAG
jgi:site-specific DNA recombinase